MTAETQPTTDLRSLLAARVHVPELGLDRPGDKVRHSSEEEIEVFRDGVRMKLFISQVVTFELKVV